MKRSAALLIGIGLLLLGPTTAQAAEPHTVCSAVRPLPPGVYGNVTAERGCRLNETHVVEGWLWVYAEGGDGGFPEVDGTRIGGDLVVEGDGDVTGAHVVGSAFFLGGYASTIRESDVGGVIWTAGGFGAMYVVGNTVGGDVILDGAGSDEVVASDNLVGGDLLVSRFSGNFSIDRNRVARNFRVTDATAYNYGPSSVSENHVGGHFEVARAEIAIFPETPAGLEPSIMVRGNEVGGHAGVFESAIRFYGGAAARSGLAGIQLRENQVAGALLCSNNSDLVAQGNAAHPALGQCRER